MLTNFVIRKGIVRGQSIVLESGTGLPDDQVVLVGIGVPATNVEGSGTDPDEVLQEIEAEEALQTILRMRHTGRSAREL